MRSTGIFFRRGDGAAEGSEAVCPLRARRGRPCQITEPERRQKLLDAAEAVFVELGYSCANMDDIARRAGMSKKTLYKLFDTKEALFAALVAARRAELSELVCNGGCIEGVPVKEVLCHYLGRVARFILAPRQAALYRLVIAESQRAPELAHAFYREGPSRARDALVTWLGRQNAQGALCVPDPSVSAAMLFSMVIGEPQMRLLIGETETPDEAAIDARVTFAVDLFLSGALPRVARSKTAEAVLAAPAALRK